MIEPQQPPAPSHTLAQHHRAEAGVGLRGRPLVLNHKSANREEKAAQTAHVLDLPESESNLGDAAPVFIRKVGFNIVMTDCTSVLVPLGLVVFAILVATLDSQSVNKQNLARWQNTITMIATTFPITFASIVGRTVYEAARWKLERGTTVASLEQLVGSRTVGATALTQFRLRKINLLGISLLILWSFSPIGSQSVLRMLHSGLESRTETSNIAYFDTNAPSMLSQVASVAEETFSGSNEVVFTYLASLFTTLLLTSASTKTSSMDIWGNVKIPVLEVNDGGNVSNTDWRDVSENLQPESYSALTGLPLTNISVGNTSFTIESSYINLHCTNLSRAESAPETENSWTSGEAPANDTWHGSNLSMNMSSPWSIAIDRFVDDYWVNLPSRQRERDPARVDLTPFIFQNDTDVKVGPTTLLFQAAFTDPSSNNIMSLSAYCSAVQQYVESRTTCSRSSLTTIPACIVAAQRPSLKKNPPSGIMLISFPEIWAWVTSELPQAAGRRMNRIDPVLRYLDDPQRKNYWTGEDSLFENTDPREFGRRLGQLINTYVLLSQVFEMARGGGGSRKPDISLTPNITISVEVGSLVEVYVVSSLFMALFLLSCIALLISGAIGAVFAHLAIGPQILGYASTVIRDSRFIELPSETREMQGMDISKMMGETKIRYGVMRLIPNQQLAVGVGPEYETQPIRHYNPTR